MFCARPRGVALKSVSTPKRSACYASAVLFLLCQSRYLLFLLGVTFFLFLYQRYSRVRANFLNAFKINHLTISLKLPSLKFCRFVSLLPDFLLWNVGPVTLHPHVCDTRVTYCALRARATRDPLPRPSTSLMRWPAAISRSRSIPVAMPSPCSRYTTSSVAMLPVAPLA